MPLRNRQVISEDGTQQPINRSNPIPTASATRGAITRLSGTVNTLGVNTLIPAPGVGMRIVVRYWIIQNLSAVSTQWYLRSGGATHFQYLGSNIGNGFSAFFTAGDDWEIQSNTPVNLALSAAANHAYTIGYWVEAG